MAERNSLRQIRDTGKRKKAGTDIGVLSALRDPQFREDVLRGLGETSARGVAGVLGAPVDLTTMAMRPFGYNVPAEQVVGGSDYIGRQMERAGLISGERRPIAEMLGGIMTPDPLDVAKLGAMAVPAIGKTLYHGSPKTVNEITPYGTFGGLFASPDRSAAASHGDIVHKMDIPEENILTNYDLNYSIDFDKTKGALKKSMPWLDDDDLDLAWKAIIEDKSNDIDADDLARIMKADPEEAGWEAQRLRGQVAKNLGYKAVEMSDEHGTSYLVLPGSKINRDVP